MSKPNLGGLLEFVRSPEARPILREVGWAGAIAIGLILLAALLAPAIAYTIYLTVGFFFAAALTGLFVSLLEKETGERVVNSPQLRKWLAGFALILAVLAAIILV